MKRLKILVWHIHGSYLNLLVQAPHDFYLPVKPGRPEGYGGRGPTFSWPDQAVEVPAEEVRNLPLDLVIHQTPKNYQEDQYEILNERQRRLPRIYLEHNTPKSHPTDTVHPVNDPQVLLVHVTHFNNIMWDSGRCPVKVIPHGFIHGPDVAYTGELPRGVVVVNGIQRRARVAGYDVWLWMKERVPLDLIGMGSAAVGGLGDFPQTEMLRRESRYRFFFNPIRYTSMPLAVVEAMSIGVPVVALATTELPTVMVDGYSGFVSNDLDYLADRMRFLLENPVEARRLGQNGRKAAEQQFGLDRFIHDWEEAFTMAQDLV